MVLDQLRRLRLDLERAITAQVAYCRCRGDSWNAISEHLVS